MHAAKHTGNTLSTLMKESSVSEKQTSEGTTTVLVGAGVVGRAIARSHLDAGLPFLLIDQDRECLEFALEELVAKTGTDELWSWSYQGAGEDHLARPRTIRPSLKLSSQESTDSVVYPSPLSSEDPETLDRLGPRIQFVPRTMNSPAQPDIPLVIESISERLEIKQDFFRRIQSILGSRAVYCTNTSNLQIQQISDGLPYPGRLCGMHFFMPVHDRHAVEVASSPASDPETLFQAVSHVMRLRKQPIRVGDSPGFIVNRLLAPYLNESMLLLCRGVSARVIEKAAKQYGMPISPLELIDWIGSRTAFDAGRAFWRSFPRRLSPSPLLPALIKHQRNGRFNGGGFYSYSGGQRSIHLSDQAARIIETYQSSQMDLDEQQVLRLLAVPMWIEAVMAKLDGVIQSSSELDSAMRGGLGFDSNRSWSSFFDRMGSDVILESIKQWESLTPSMSAPAFVTDSLRNLSPREVIDHDQQRSANVA